MQTYKHSNIKQFECKLLKPEVMVKRMNKRDTYIVVWIRILYLFYIKEEHLKSVE